MQIIILGMHRSGTSATARLINMMGAYFAPEGMALPPDVDNPKGFWERRDVMRINDALLTLQDCRWDRPAHWRFKEAANVPEKLHADMRQLVLHMDAFRPWFIKDPRMCLTLPAWRPLLEAPVAVIVYRDPLEIAVSLHKRNQLPMDVGMALWEYHAVGLLNASLKLPRIFVSHAELLQKPVKTAEALLRALKAQGVRRLAMPSAAEIRAFIDPTLYRSQAKKNSMPLNPRHQTLVKLLRGQIPPKDPVHVSEESKAVMKTAQAQG